MKKRLSKISCLRKFSGISLFFIVLFSGCTPGNNTGEIKPNIVFVFADQWRAQDLGFAGNAVVKTPVLNKLARESVVFTNAISGCPVCCPYRASLLTGQYPLTHGVFYNDKPLDPQANSMAKIFKKAGYETAYIGKWHLNGHEPGEKTFEARQKFIPVERRQGFDFWQVLECTHDYNNSFYFEDTPEMKKWEGYDAIAQTNSATNYIRGKAKGENPFLLMLSWEPPHDPYQTAPEKYRQMYSTENIELRPNVPDSLREKARENIAGYYAHISALDDCMREILLALDEAGLKNNTIFVFTSDHGDMLYSHGQKNKQQPFDESIKVPFILRYPAKFGNTSARITAPFNTPDILPTLLELANIDIPETVEGSSFLKVMSGEGKPASESVLIQCAVPFHQWNYSSGGREYRGVRSERFTYVRDLNGPWLLFDNVLDPFQMNNLLGIDEYIFIQSDLERQLQEWLKKTNDNFLPGSEYMKLWNYTWDRNDSIQILQ